METDDREVMLPWLLRSVVRVLAPSDERRQIVDDLATEAAEIHARDGRRAAVQFVRWQVAHSAWPWIGRRATESVIRSRRSLTMAYRGLWFDLRLAARRLRQAPGFAVLAVATLAIGIGSVSTAFSLAHALWLKPLPYFEPDRLVWIQGRHVPSNSTASLTATEIAEYRRPSQSLAGVAAFQYGAGIGRVNDEPVRIVAHRVTPNLFGVLGVRPALGRDFRDADAATNAHVLLISDAFWAAHFSRDASVVGRNMALLDTTFEIVGVLPRDGAFPRGLLADVFVPTDFSRGEESASRGIQAVARLAPGKSIADVTAELGVRARQLAGPTPAADKDWTVMVSPADGTASRASQVAFEVLLGVVGLFLLAACTNLAGLLLARNSARRAELAVCLSVGATPWRLTRMLLAEGVLLSGLGCGTGVLLASYGARGLASLLPSNTPGLDDIALSIPVLTVTALVSVVSAVLVGVLPALGLRSIRPAEALAGARTVARGTSRAQRALVIAEVALAAMLLVGAGSMLRSFSTLLNRDRGYEPKGLLALNVSLPFSDDSYLPIDRRARAFDEIFARVAAVPGVTRVAATTGFPGSALGVLGGMPVTPADGHAAVMAALHSATPGYFETMGIPMLRGRAFTGADVAKRPPVAIVNELLAHEFPDGNPVGKRIPLTIFGDTSVYEVVGVAGNIRLGERIGYRVFVPLAQVSPYWVDVVIRANASGPVMAAVRQSLRSFNRDLLIENDSSFQRIISDSVALERAESAFAAVVGVLAAVIAGVGIYALMTFMATERRREFGIRLALGSPPGRLFRDALTDAGRLAIAGLGIGLAAAIALVKIAGTQVFGLASADTRTFVIASALVLAVSLAAVWVPARRVMRIDPLAALRGK